MKLLRSIIINLQNWVDQQNLHYANIRRQKILEFFLWITSLGIVIGGYILLFSPTNHITSPLELKLTSWTIWLTFISIIVLAILNRVRADCLAGFLFVLMFLLIATFSYTPEQIVNGRGVLIFTIPIITSSILLAPWASFIFASLSSLVIAFFAIDQGAPPNFMNMLVFFALALIIWFSVFSLDRALENLREFNQVLQVSEEELRQREELYRLLAENMVDVIWTVDGENHFTYVSPSVFQLRGLSPEEALRETIDQTMTPESLQVVLNVAEQGRQAELHGKTDFVSRFDIEQYCKDGKTVWVECITKPLYDEQGQRIGVLGVSRNITERKRARESERAQRDLAEALSDSTAALNSTLDFDNVLDRILDNVGRVVSHDAVDIFLLDADGRSARIVGHHNNRSQLTEAKGLQFSISQTRNLREMQATGVPVIIADTNKYEGWVDRPLSAWIRSNLGVPITVKDKIIGFLVLSSGIFNTFTKKDAERLQAFADHAAIAIENARLYEKVSNLAISDALTGVYNRAFFEAELDRMELGRDFPVSVVVADLDDMKATNDKFGHVAGDDLLKRTVLVLQDVFRASDIVARIGGDEFAILLPKTDSVVAERMLSRVRSKLKKHNIAHPDLPIELSLGASTAEKGDLMKAFTDADQRMYADKAARKST